VYGDSTYDGDDTNLPSPGPESRGVPGFEEDPTMLGISQSVDTMGSGQTTVNLNGHYDSEGGAGSNGDSHVYYDNAAAGVGAARVLSLDGLGESPDPYDSSPDARMGRRQSVESFTGSHNQYDSDQYGSPTSEQAHGMLEDDGATPYPHPHDRSRSISQSSSFHGSESGSFSAHGDRPKIPLVTWESPAPSYIDMDMTSQTPHVASHGGGFGDAPARVAPMAPGVQPQLMVPRPPPGPPPTRPPPMPAGEAELGGMVAGWDGTSEPASPPPPPPPLLPAAENWEGFQSPVTGGQVPFRQLSFGGAPSPAVEAEDETWM